MACLDDNALSGFIQGTLVAEERARVEAHIDQCANCRLLLSALGQIADRQPLLRLEQVIVPGVPAPGEVIAGKYRVERILGEGGMGVVVAATHLDLQQIVALKFMRPQVENNPSAVKRFLAEARAVVRLRSSHVGRVLDLGKLESGVPYIAMEYLEGIDLERHVELHGPLKVDEAIRYMLQALEAIAEAHAAGIVHRDLKPANLFLTTGPEGEPWIKVLDFGVSKYTEQSWSGSLDRTDARTVLGSPLYMSPEQLRSATAADARSDIWSLGCTLYQLVTGRPPFDELSLPDLTSRILNDPPRPLLKVRPDVPQAYADLVAHCLQKEPAKRPQSAVELSDLLAALKSEGGIPRKHPRAGRAWAFAAAVAGAVAVSGIAVAGFTRATRPVASSGTSIDPVAVSLPALAPLPEPAAIPPENRPRTGGQAATPRSAKPKVTPPKPSHPEDEILGRRQ